MRQRVPPRQRQAAGRRQRRQHDQRQRHRPRALMHMMLLLIRSSECAGKRQEDEPEHVVRGAERRERAENPDEPSRAGGEVRRRQHRAEDLVLREEAGERRESGDGDRGDEERPRRDGDLLPQPAHVADVLLAAHGVNHRARSEEEAGFEEGVRDEVEDAGGEGADADTDEHETELRDGGVGQDFLDVPLPDADGRSEERGERADEGDHHHRVWRYAIQRVGPHHHVDAGGDHRRGVDERRHRRRSGHGVGQPDVERDLRALTARAEEEQEADGGDHDVIDAGVKAGTGADGHRDLRHLREIDAAEIREHQEHGDEKAEVADAVDDERFLSRRGRVVGLVVEADQEVGAESDSFPSDEHQ